MFKRSYFKALFFLVAGLLCLLGVASDNVFQGLVDQGCLLFHCGDSIPQRPLTYALLFISLTFLVRNNLNYNTTAARIFIGGLLIALGLRYLSWRIFSIVGQWQSDSLGVQLFFLAVELAVYTNSLLFVLITAWPTNRSAEADLLQVDVDAGNFLPSVDILIPSYNEDAQMLRRTICAAQAIDYPRELLRVFLLDDSRRDHIRDLCKQLGCHYVRRPDNLGHKAGNVNHALKHAIPAISADLLVLFDADFMPVSHFLRRTVGFFQDAKVALLQTPQLFYSADAPRQNLGLPNSTANEEDLFFQVIQPGRDRFNATMCHGTCFVVRRAVLEEIGGLPTESLCEDWATSISIQANGYKVPYLNERLSSGASAITVANFVKQRLRWAQGTWQILLTPLSPLRVGGLTVMQRVVHMAGILHWMMSICSVITMLLPIIFFTTGTGPFRITLEEAIAYWLPYYGATALAFCWLTKGYRSFFWSDIYGPILAVPVFLSFLKFLWNPFGGTFQVTQKSGAPGARSVCWSVLWPILAILAAYGVAASYYAINFIWLEVDRASSPLMIILTAYNSIMLFISALVCIDLPERRQSIRVPVTGTVTISDEFGWSKTVYLADISEGGVLLAEPIADQAKGSIFYLSIAELGIANLVTTIGEERARQQTMLVFDQQALLDCHYRAIVEFLYTHPSRWAKPEVSEVSSLAAIVRILINWPALTARSR
ncbi:MAG: UDP-glucose-beta-D-glucan glucosyltransferase [Cyanobacteria bacterium DS3.002]|nr:UDP-glucose-beta-D-glucan glucosyltransferase [Cyanobacteria bacterium DS3.002]MBA4049423.1 UDP-glucose-beta-D-glucan glucosyltransferase [Cyanobacteria bacterium DS2.008]